MNITKLMYSSAFKSKVVASVITNHCHQYGVKLGLKPKLWFVRSWNVGHKGGGRNKQPHNELAVGEKVYSHMYLLEGENS